VVDAAPAVGESRQDGTAPRRTALYALARLLCRAAIGAFAEARVEGLEDVPRSGPLIVLCNHASMVDPVLLTATFPRWLTYLAKRELFRQPLVGWLLREGGVIPVSRGAADRHALEQALGALRQGGAVAIFAEGTRSRDGVLQRAKAGVALLAARSGAGVLPVAIVGTQGLDAPRRWLTHPQLVVRCGRPLSPGNRPGREGYQAAADRYMAEVAALLPAWQRGLYGSGGADEPRERTGSPT